jgi:hypothetical protein
MKQDEAELWIVNLIRNARLDAKVSQYQHVSAYHYICVRILLYVSAYYYIFVLVLLHVSSYYYVCVLMLLHVSSYKYKCVLRWTRRSTSSLCVLILVHTSPHTRIRVLILVHVSSDGLKEALLKGVRICTIKRTTTIDVSSLLLLYMRPHTSWYVVRSTRRSTTSLWAAPSLPSTSRCLLICLSTRALLLEPYTRALLLEPYTRALLLEPYTRALLLEPYTSVLGLSS